MVANAFDLFLGWKSFDVHSLRFDISNSALSRWKRFEWFIPLNNVHFEWNYAFVYDIVGEPINFIGLIGSGTVPKFIFQSSNSILTVILILFHSRFVHSFLRSRFINNATTTADDNIYCFLYEMYANFCENIKKKKTTTCYASDCDEQQ